MKSQASLNRFVILGKHAKNVRVVKKQFTSAGFTHTKTKPDFVVSLGGDGSYLYAERKYPSTPKILLRDSYTGNQCTHNTVTEVIAALLKGSYTIKKHIKLEAHIHYKGKKKKVICTNDFILRNKDPTQALRFTVTAKKKTSDEYIGDGVVISTPFGSTAYFYSITQKKFTSGIGIAYNNLTHPVTPTLLADKGTIKIKLNRSTAEFAADNNPLIHTVQPGSTIFIKKHHLNANIIQIKVGLKALWQNLLKNRRTSFKKS